MNSMLAKIKIGGLFSYLVTRSKLRFLDRIRITIKNKKYILFGQEVSLNLTDLEQKYLAADCVREPENLIVYRAISDSGLVDTFIDIGANCGHVAASIVNDYAQIFLFEPNPKLAALLRDIYKTQGHVAIRECAVVDKRSVGNLMLTVPDKSSGLATLGSTSLSKQHKEIQQYVVKASTLSAEIENSYIKNSYIKIDVEGFEKNIIDSASELITSHRPIVGFEALSNEAALSCANLFDNYTFYCARFDFLERGGALSKSIFGMIKALTFGANIEILKISCLKNNELQNYSQVFSVPDEKVAAFEKSILNYSKSIKVFNLSGLNTWS